MSDTARVKKSPFRYIAILNPADSEYPQEILREGTVLAVNVEQAKNLVIAQELSNDERDRIEEIEVLVRPF